MRKWRVYAERQDPQAVSDGEINEKILLVVLLSGSGSIPLICLRRSRAWYMLCMQYAWQMQAGTRKSMLKLSLSSTQASYDMCA